MKPHVFPSVKQIPKEELLYVDPVARRYSIKRFSTSRFPKINREKTVPESLF